MLREHPGAAVVRTAAILQQPHMDSGTGRGPLPRAGEDSHLVTAGGRALGNPQHIGLQTAEWKIFEQSKCKPHEPDSRYLTNRNDRDNICRGRKISSGIQWNHRFSSGINPGKKRFPP